jgi:hypothetical protein
MIAFVPPRRYWLHEIKAREGADINAEYMLASDYDALAVKVAALEAEVRALRSAGYSCPTCGNDAVDSVAE